MPRDHTIPLPEPGTLRAGGPPYLSGRSGIGPITTTFILAASAAVAAGVILFGWNVLRVLAICVATAVLVESVTRSVAGRPREGAERHALLLGLLTACTMPAGVFWAVPLCAVTAAVLVGHALSGGPGNYLWHPVALGRIAVELIFPEQMNPGRWPVLGPGHLGWGDLTASWSLPPLWSWSNPLPENAEAWLVVRPVDVLRQVLAVPAQASPAEGIGMLVRDALPPWLSMFTGVAGGPIGEACLLAIVVAGLFLMWRGWLKWPLPTMAVLAAAAMAAVLPVSLHPPGSPGELHWFPGADFHIGLPVGLVYVIYQATAGELPLVATLLAADPTSSPLTTRGHTLFGAVIGALTIALRVGLGLPAAGYWALLIANALVPLINRATRRRVLGT